MMALIILALCGFFSKGRRLRDDVSRGCLTVTANYVPRHHIQKGCICATEPPAGTGRGGRETGGRRWGNEPWKRFNTIGCPEHELMYVCENFVCVTAPGMELLNP